VQQHTGTGLPCHWSGFFFLPPGQMVVAGGYQLALDGGQVVDIQVRHVGRGLRGTWIAYFEGMAETP
jgi:hypothetical protein